MLEQEPNEDEFLEEYPSLKAEDPRIRKDFPSRNPRRGRPPRHPWHVAREAARSYGVKFLIDECCAKSLTRIAHAAGFEATRTITSSSSDLPAAKTMNLRNIILREEFTFVTNNAEDFLRIFKLMELLLRADHSQTKRVARGSSNERLFSLALTEVKRRQLTDLVNRVVEVDFEGAAIYDLPAPQ